LLYFNIAIEDRLAPLGIERCANLKFENRTELFRTTPPCGSNALLFNLVGCPNNGGQLQPPSCWTAGSSIECSGSIGYGNCAVSTA